MAVSINELKSGLTILIDGNVYQVIEYQHVKPGKGAAFVRTKLKNLKNGYIQEKTFRSEEKIEAAFVEEKKLQYLYSLGDFCHFMDEDNFEEITLAKENLGDKIKFLKDSLNVSAYFYKNEILNISLPNLIEFKVIHTEPGMRGDTAKAATKPAKIESGAVIQVPLFINVGDIIKVDIRSGEYLGRV